MKHSKLSRRLAVALSAVLVVGCISFNAFAEDLTESMEIVAIEDEVSLDVDTIDLGVEEVYVEDDIYVEDVIDSSDDLFIPEEDEIIISDVVEIIDESADVTVETEAAPEEVEEEVAVEVAEEMDTAEVEDMLAGFQATISLNYAEYTMTEVGETLLLTAAVNVPEEVVMEEVVEEVLVDAEEAVYEEETTEFDNAVTWASSDEAVVKVDETGLVTAVASGEATVTCTLAADETVTAVCVINVAAGCTLEVHIHSFEGCYVRELICEHTSEEEHTYECFLNKFVCGMEEHVHQDDCFNTADKVVAEELNIPAGEVQDEVVLEEVTYEEDFGSIAVDPV